MRTATRCPCRGCPSRPRWALNPTGDTLLNASPVNTVNGMATFSYLSLKKAASGYTLTASASGMTGATSAPFTITAAAAATLAFTVQPSNTIAGAVISPAVQVTVTDAYGNLVVTPTAVTLALGANPGAATLAGTLTANTVNGVATFSTLMLTKAATGYTLTATAGTLPAVTSAAFNITALAPATLSFTTQPSTTSAGIDLAAVQVTVKDSLGNLVAPTAVTLALGANPGNATLAGTLTATTVNGVATFSTLKLTKAATGYTLTATVGTLPAVTSTTFNITASTQVAALVFTVQPSTTAVTAKITPAVQVTATDAYGNLVATSSDTITLALGANPGGATLGGTLYATTANGVATFSTLTLSRAATGYTLIAKYGTLTVTSAAFNITPAAAATLAFTVQPTTTLSGNAITPAVQVTVKDSLRRPGRSDHRHAGAGREPRDRHAGRHAHRHYRQRGGHLQQRGAHHPDHGRDPVGLYPDGESRHAAGRHQHGVQRREPDLAGVDLLHRATAQQREGKRRADPGGAGHGAQRLRPTVYHLHPRHADAAD